MHHRSKPKAGKPICAIALRARVIGRTRSSGRHYGQRPLRAASTGRTHGRTDRRTEHQKYPCQRRAVHTWRKSEIGYQLPRWVDKTRRCKSGRARTRPLFHLPMKFTGRLAQRRERALRQGRPCNPRIAWADCPSGIDGSPDPSCWRTWPGCLHRKPPLSRLRGRHPAAVPPVERPPCR
jgi:hypothetical protein